MRTPIISLTVLALVFLTAQTVFSKEKDKGHRSEWRAKILKQYDANGDGKLDDEERDAMKNAWAEKWEKRKGKWNNLRKQYDKDGDGKLNDDEHNDLCKAVAKKGDKHGKFDLARHLITRFDKNNDGKINADEVDERFQKHFKNVDANADGTVNKKEINKAAEKAKIKFISHVQNRVFDKIDQNDDGKIDIEKVVAKLHGRLKKLDVSDDGFIDKSEFKAIVNRSSAAQNSSSQRRDQVEAELERLRQAIDKLAESLKEWE